jgi:hypothetical protein
MAVVAGWPKAASQVSTMTSRTIDFGNIQAILMKKTAVVYGVVCRWVEIPYITMAGVAGWPNVACQVSTMTSRTISFGIIQAILMKKTAVVYGVVCRWVVPSIMMAEVAGCPNVACQASTMTSRTICFGII